MDPTRLDTLPSTSLELVPEYHVNSLRAHSAYLNLIRSFCQGLYGGVAPGLRVGRGLEQGVTRFKYWGGVLLV